MVLRPSWFLTCRICWSDITPPLIFQLETIAPSTSNITVAWYYLYYVNLVLHNNSKQASWAKVIKRSPWHARSGWSHCWWRGKNGSQQLEFSVVLFAYARQNIVIKKTSTHNDAYPRIFPESNPPRARVSTYVGNLRARDKVWSEEHTDNESAVCLLLCWRRHRSVTGGLSELDFESHWRFDLCLS